MLRGLVATAVAVSLTPAVLVQPGGTGAAATPVDSPRAGTTLTIYSSLPMQGPFRPQSRDMVLAMQMALADHGGRAGGHPIRYVSLDGASPESGFPEPDIIIDNARTAARDPQTIAYLGDFNSGSSALSIPILNKAGVLQVSPSNTIVGLTRAEGASEGEPDRYYPTGKRTYGRVVPADHIQARALVAYMADKACADVYIVHNREDLGEGLADLVEASAAVAGITVLANEGVRADTKKVRAAARRVAAAGADCFFFGGVTASKAPLLFKAVGAKSPDITLFGPDGLAETAFTERLGADLEDRVFLTGATLNRKGYPKKGREFLDDFKARYGRYPKPYAIYAYEAMKVVLKAIGEADPLRADKAGRRAVVKAFFNVADRRSVLGRYSIDEFGDTTLRSYGGLRVHDGLVVFDKVLTAVPPAP